MFCVVFFTTNFQIPSFMNDPIKKKNCFHKCSLISTLFSYFGPQFHLHSKVLMLFFNFSANITNSIEQISVKLIKITKTSPTRKKHFRYQEKNKGTTEIGANNLRGQNLKFNPKVNAQNARTAQVQFFFVYVVNGNIFFFMSMKFFVILINLKEITTIKE